MDATHGLDHAWNPFAPFAASLIRTFERLSFGVVPSTDSGLSHGLKRGSSRPRTTSSGGFGHNEGW